MPQNLTSALHWAEKGLIPDPFLRRGIRRLLKDRLTELQAGNPWPSLTSRRLSSPRCARPT
jgi:cyclopropane-fatty-acyl-phospholipid synthase